MTTEEKPVRRDELSMRLRDVVTSIILSSLVSCLVVLGGGWGIVSTVFDVHIAQTHPGSARISDVQQISQRVGEGFMRLTVRLDKIDAVLEKIREAEDDD